MKGPRSGRAEEKDEIVGFDFGEDASCKEYLASNHTKVLKDPAPRGLEGA